MFKHPKGLAILFFTEMWERFSYYGMKAILMLYIISSAEKGGLGWSEAEGYTLLGWFTMLVYVSSVPGGIIADKYLGQKRSVIMGGILLCVGNILMIFTPIWAFFSALTFIILGTGLLKPNISTLVGGLYADNDPRRESGFTIFYMGINLGAFVATLLVGYIGEKVNWHWGFGLAALGMLTAQTVFILGQKHVQSIASQQQLKEAKLENRALTTVERKRIGLILLSFIIVCVFWMSFEQAGGLMTVYSEKYTNRWLMGWEIPASWFQSLNPLFIIIFGGVVAFIWNWLAKRKKNPNSMFKMGLGTMIMGTGFLFMVGATLQREAIGHSAMYWLVFAYLFHTIGELCLSPVSLSFITKMAPKHKVATMIGLYFAVTGIAQKLAAEIGKMSIQLGEYKIFVSLVILPISLGLLLLLFSKRLSKMSGGIEE